MDATDPRDVLAIATAADPRGCLPARPRLAVVGARAAERSLRAAVPHVVEVLAQRGWSLVSGGALGIDGDAHRAALACGVGQIAVVPSGADRPYPPVHAPLFAAIEAAGGAVLYMRARGCSACRGQFASRNRTVIALADAVLVVQAAMRSGTLGTGRLALRRAVPTAAVVGSVGAAELVARGATALPWDLADPHPFRDALAAWLRGESAVPDPWPADLLWLCAPLQAAGAVGVTLDGFADPAAAAVDLLRAQAQGWVCETMPGRWTRAR